MIVACDVRTAFVDAAAVYGPQKGASPAQVELLTRRLRRLAQIYERDYGVDVTAMPGAGAAGGLAGGLAARGAILVNGFDVVTEEIDLRDRIGRCDLVVTGEGRFDATSLEGKVVGGAARLATEAGVPALAVVGSADPQATPPEGLEIVDLTLRFGWDRARSDTCGCVRAAVSELAGGVQRRRFSTTIQHARPISTTMSMANEINQANTATAHRTSEIAPSTDSAPITTSAGRDGPLVGSTGPLTSLPTGRSYRWPIRWPGSGRRISEYSEEAMAVTVRVPTTLRVLTAGASEVAVDGATLADVLDSLESSHPGFRDRILDESGELRRFVNVFVSDDDVRFLDGLGTTVDDGATVSIVPAVAGGRA